MGLFKFLGPERIEVLRNCSIRFTQPGAFNDPFEFQPDVTFGDDDRKGIPQMAPPGTSSPDIYGAILKGVTSKEAKARELLNRLNGRFGILSLANSPGSLPMWAYYAENHKGFVIEFDQSHEFFVHLGGNSALRPVTYSVDRPRYAMGRLTPEQDLELSRQVMTTKGPQWRHEEEVRIVANLSDGKAIPGKRDPGGFPIFLFDLPPKSIRRVIFGLRMSDDNRREIRRILNEDRYSHVHIDAAELHDTRFDLEFLPRRPVGPKRNPIT